MWNGNSVCYSLGGGGNRAGVVGEDSSGERAESGQALAQPHQNSLVWQDAKDLGIILWPRVAPKWF